MPLALCDSGIKPIDVSIHVPQLHPPPPSGDNSMPPAGMVLNQQSGLSRGQLVALPFSPSHMVTVLERKNSASAVHAYVPQPPPGNW